MSVQLKDNQKLMSEWNYEKNIEKPDKFSYKSSKKVWWKCENGHEWQATIYNRSNGTNCPYCTNQRILKGFNDLATLRPELLKEWNYEKNTILPESVGIGTSKKVWWKCENGHEWQASINSRDRMNTHCPICGTENGTSFPEQAIFYYCKNYLENYNIYNRFIFQDKYEADIYLEKLKLAIEYDGYYYHNTSNSIERENKKNMFFKNNSIKLIRIKEGISNDYYSKNSFDIIGISKNPNFKDINLALNKLFIRIFDLYGFSIKPVEFNTEKDRFKIMDNYIMLEKENSLMNKFPEIAEEWDYEKNGNLKPNSFSVGSQKKVWWKCKNCCHSWQANINTRTNGYACPKCGCKKSIENNIKNKIKKMGSFLTNYPELAKEWNYEKNNGLTPNNVTAKSNKKVWWICSKCGGEYEQVINKKSIGRGCPYCSNKKVLKGFNDLKTTNPELLKEWDYNKNRILKIYPDEISKGSDKNVWWICSICENAYIKKVYAKLENKGCPYCSSKKVLKGYNDLTTTSKIILNMWNYKKNDKLNIYPYNFSKGSSKKVWWICPNCNNEWEQRINHITNGIGCPKCHYNILKIKKGKTSF